jgi:hypothetical protein
MRVMAILIAQSFLVVQCGVDEAAKFGDKSFLDSPRDQSQDAVVSDGQGGGGIDPETIVLQARYKSRFHAITAERLVNNEPPDTEFGVAQSTVMDKLTVVGENDGVQISQTYGDGVALSNGRQVITNNAGDQDVNVEAGGTSASGVQTFVRTTADETCPSQTICVSEVKFEPNIGQPATFCFFDAVTNEARAIPYAIAPNYALKDLEPMFGEYGPYRVERYKGTDVSCDGDGLVVVDHYENIIITIGASGRDLQATPRLFQNSKLKYDYAITITNRRVENDNVAPYIDETIKMQQQTDYLFDELEGMLAKMIKRARTSVELPFPVNLIMSMDGLAVDLHFEYCENLLVTDAPSYCGGE